MSGTHLGGTPHSDEEWARDVQRRLESLEQPAAVRAGDWVLTTSPETGNLIASHVGGGSVVLTTPPPAGQDPDAVVDSSLPALQVSLVSPGQNLPANSVQRIRWNQIDRNIGGWRLTGERDEQVVGDGSTAWDSVYDIGVPLDGLYLITLRLSWQNAANRVAKAMLHLDDHDVDAVESRWPDGANVTPSLYITTQRWLSEGTNIAANGWSNVAGLLTAPGTDPMAHPTLSVTCLRGPGNG